MEASRTGDKEAALRLYEEGMALERRKLGSEHPETLTTIASVGYVCCKLERFAEGLYADIGLDLRGQTFDHFYEAHLTSGSAVEMVDGHMEVTVWKPGEGERVVRRT